MAVASHHVGLKSRAMAQDVTISKPKKMSRAKSWSPEVENAWRFQIAGWRDEHEYAASHGAPDTWEETGWIRKLSIKDAMQKVQAAQAWYYYSRKRECEAKHVNQVKLYSY